MTQEIHRCEDCKYVLIPYYTKNAPNIWKCKTYLTWCDFVRGQYGNIKLTCEGFEKKEPKKSLWQTFKEQAKESKNWIAGKWGRKYSIAKKYGGR